MHKHMYQYDPLKVMTAMAAVMTSFQEYQISV